MYSNTASDVNLQNADLMAAVDLGSNSFHILIVDVSSGRAIPLRRWGEKVQLAADMNGDETLSLQAKQRGYQCLQSFVDELAGIPSENILIVGTDIFRRAKDCESFVEHAQAILNSPIKVLSGEEEARMIFQGVVAHQKQPSIDTLVLDIGGGSTEVAVGNKNTDAFMDSLPLGCVSYGERFFPDRCATPYVFAQAVSAISQEIELVAKKLCNLQWRRAIGTSGTILSIESVLQGMGLSHTGISRNSLAMLVDRICCTKTIDELKLVGLSPTRSDIFLPGVAILSALFETLNIEEIQTCQYDLREGLIASMLA